MKLISTLLVMLSLGMTSVAFSAETTTLIPSVLDGQRVAYERVGVTETADELCTADDSIVAVVVESADGTTSLVSCSN